MVETRAQAKLKNKTVEMTSETPESTPPITETVHSVGISASIPVTTDRSAESMQEQAAVEEMMSRQTYRIETSFMAAMDRFSLELRTLFQERMPITSPASPPRAGQGSRGRERIEPYGEGSSLGASAHPQASGYGQHSVPPINSWGQSQSAVVLGQSSPTHSTHGHNQGIISRTHQRSTELSFLETTDCQNSCCSPGTDIPPPSST